MESASVKQVCPVQCKYCMASKIDTRSSYWNSGYRIGVNKTCTFINRFPKDPPLAEMDIPWDALEGEYVGFEGASDCMWEPYREDLAWLIAHIDEFKIRKLILTTKIPTVPVDILKQNPHICVVFSLTGMDALEKTMTIDRVRAMKKLRDAGVEVHAIIHPYIHGYSDLSFLTEYKAAGFTTIGVKGFRYNPAEMQLSEIPEEVLARYRGDQEEEEIGIEEATRRIENMGIQVKGLRDMVHNDRRDFQMTAEKAQWDADTICSFAVISSSDPETEHIRKAIINRKFCGHI